MGVEPFAMVPMSLAYRPEATASDFKVMSFIVYRAGKRGYWWGCQEEIREAIHLSERSIREAVKRLVAWGYITVTRLGADRATQLEYRLAGCDDSLEEEAQTGSALPVAHEPSGSTVPVADRPTGSRLPVRPEAGFRSDRKQASGAYKESSDPSVDHSSEISLSDARPRFRLVEPNADPEPSPGRLTSEQELVLQHLHDRATRDVFAGGSPQWGYCRDLAVQGMTRSDVDAGIEAALMKRTDNPAMRSSGVLAYCRAVIERRVEEREAGHDPDKQRDVRGPAGRGPAAASNGARARAHGGHARRVAGARAIRGAVHDGRWDLPPGQEHRAAGLAVPER